MGTQPQSQSVTSAREAVRDKSDGQFGVQNHTESGIVEVDFSRFSGIVGQALETSRVMEALGAYLGDEPDFDNFDGELFRHHLECAVTAINIASPGSRFDVEYRIDADGTEQKCLVALTDDRSGMSIIDFVDDTELTLDRDAYGSNGAHAVIGGLLGHRSRLQERLKAAMKQIKSSPNQEA